MTSVYIKEGFEKGRTAGFNAGMLEGRNIGFSAGRNAGMLEGSLNTARNMRSAGMPNNEIARYTGLPLSALENL